MEEILKIKIIQKETHTAEEEWVEEWVEEWAEVAILTETVEEAHVTIVEETRKEVKQ